MRWYSWVMLSLLIVASLTFIIYLMRKETKENKVKMTTKELMYIVSFSTLAVTLGFIEIPLGTIIPGGKIDFSEVVILMTFLLLGKKNVIIVILFRSIVRITIPNELDFIMQLLGELIAITASIIIVMSTVLFNKLFKRNKQPLLYAVSIDQHKQNYIDYIFLPLITTTLLVVLLFVFHYFITLPIFAKIYAETYIGFKAKFLVIMPFTVLNIIKGVISPLLFLFLKPNIEKMVKYI